MNPELEIVVSISGGAGRDGFATHEVSEVWTKAAVGHGTGDGVAIDAGSFFKDVTSRGGGGMCGLLFRGNPPAELLGRIDVDAQEHFGVLRAAVLGTLTDVHAGFVRLDPHRVDAIGDEVGFAGELRNPKTVVGIGGNQFDEGGRPVCRVTHRNVELVGGDDAERRIAELPPELMTSGRDFDCAWGRDRLLNGVNDARGSKEEYQDDEDRDNRPRQLHLIAAIDLGRLAPILRSAVAELSNGVEEE